MYEYIVVGAGSAGCVLAARLSESPKVQVLLIEAGPPDNKREIHIPAAFSKLFKTGLDWNFSTEPQEHLEHRRLYWPRGKVLGGSSSINAMIYARGRRADFDLWRSQGNEGWGWEDVLPLFKASENNQRESLSASAEHASGGPLSVSDLRETNRLSQAFLEACESCGIPRNDDFNGPGQQGCGFYQVTQKRGERASAADAFLKPALRRGNLAVWTGIHSTRVMIENGRAVGVEYMRNGSIQQVHASREVILAAGAVGSPHLLLLSGIGPRHEVESSGIAAVGDLPGVGANLQDHLSVGIPHFSTQPVTLNQAGTLMDFARYVAFRRGPLTSNVAEAGAFVKSRPDLDECDLQFHFGPVHYIEHGFVNPGGHGFSVGPTLLNPRSRGRLYLRTANPLDPPSIDPAYLSDAADVVPLIEGVKLARKLVAARAFDAYRGEAALEQTDPESYIRARAETIYHPVGTCKMGMDEMSVVNARLEVHGVSGLRVADASIMPVIIGANTNAATIMIAEKAARMIKESGPS